MPDIAKNTADPSATSPGAILKRCREYHDLSLEEAEESTKIGANYLSALEEDQVSQFSSLAYLKGFLRIYATYLGLNPDDMIRLYEKLYSAGNRGGDHTAAAAGGGDPAPRKKFPLQKLAMPAVILVLILITAAIINRSPSPPVRQNLPESAAPQATAAPVLQVRSSVRQPVPKQTPDEAVNEQKRSESQPAALGSVQKSVEGKLQGFRCPVKGYPERHIESHHRRVLIPRL